MQTLSKSEGSAVLGLGPIEQFFDDVASRLESAIAYEVPSQSSRITALARLISELVLSDCQILLWITGWGVWPSSENWDLFNGYRRSLGETRQIAEAPLHAFGVTDVPALATLLSLVLSFGWDAQLTNTTGAFMFTISHDEWLEVQASRQMSDGSITRELDGFGLRRLALETTR